MLRTVNHKMKQQNVSVLFLVFSFFWFLAVDYATARINQAAGELLDPAAVISYPRVCGTCFLLRR